MSYQIKDSYDDKIIEACNNNLSMNAACAEVGLHFNTFKNRAIYLGVYKPNQGGKGLYKKRKIGNGKFDINDILNDKHPQYNTFKLKKRLIKSGIFEKKCYRCGITIWNGKDIEFELDHKDGNRFNHKKENLELLCPNCHSQTTTYKGRNTNSRK